MPVRGWYARLCPFGYGALTIPYDGAAGDYTKVIAGMTLYVGSTVGGSDLGKVRVKSATSTVLTVAANSDVNWADNVYLTVKEIMELWTVFPRLSTVDPFPWYKDLNVPYLTGTDDNYRKPTVWLPPIPMMGPPDVTFLDSNIADVTFLGGGYVAQYTDAAAQTWTYSSATSFTLAGDYSKVFGPPMELRYRQGGAYKYSYVTSAVYAAGATTVTTSGDALANAAFTDKWYGALLDGSYTMCSSNIKIGGVGQGDVHVVGYDTPATAGKCTWGFADGAVQSGSATALGTENRPNVVRFTTAGRRLVSLKVAHDKPTYSSSAYVKSTTGYRPTFVLNRPGTAAGVNEPYQNFNVETMQADAKTGGWTATIRVFGNADTSQFPDNTMIVLFAEEFWGGSPYGLTPTAPTKQSIGGYPGREPDKLVAWIMSETVHEDFDQISGQHYVEFQCATMDGLLNARTGYALMCQDMQSIDDCTEWYYMFKLQLNRVLLYMVAFHTTLFNMCDLNIIGINAGVQAAGAPVGSLYRQLDDYGASAMNGRLLCNKQSCLFIDRNLQTAPTAQQTATPIVMALYRTKHLRETFEFPRPHVRKTRALELTAVTYSGGNANALVAHAPGFIPAQDGIDDSKGGFILNNQAEANELAGKLWAADNNQWTGLPFKLQGNFSFLDITPNAYLTLSVAAAETKRAFTWLTKKIIPQSITMSYKATEQAMLVDMTADAQADATMGITGTYRVNLPVVYNPTKPAINVPGWNNVLYAGTTVGLYRIIAGSSDWQKITPAVAPFDGTVDLSVNGVVIDPFTSTKGVNTDVIANTSQGLFRGHFSLDTFQWSWSKWVVTDPPDSWTDTPAPTLATCTLTSLAADYVHAGTFYVGVTSAAGHSWLLKIVDSAGVQTGTYLPLSTNYPTLTNAISTIYNLQVDTQDASRVYLTYKRGTAYGLMVMPSAMNAVTRYHETDSNVNFSGPLYVAVPWYHSGGTRTGNHVIVYGSVTITTGSYTGAAYSTDGGVTLSALNTGARQFGSNMQIVPDAINESSYQVLLTNLSPLGGNYASVKLQTVWGADWGSENTFNILPGRAALIMAQDPRNSAVVVNSVYNIVTPRHGPVEIVGSGVYLSVNGVISNFELDSGLPVPFVNTVQCLAVDWGR